MNDEYFSLMDQNSEMREDLKFEKDLCTLDNASLKDDNDALKNFTEKITLAQDEGKDVIVSFLSVNMYEAKKLIIESFRCTYAKCP